MLEPAKTSRGCSAKDAVYFADCEGRTLLRRGLWPPDSGTKERSSSITKWIPLANDPRQGRTAYGPNGASKRQRFEGRVDSASQISMPKEWRSKIHDVQAATIMRPAAPWLAEIAA
jgi:hypothetical protein